MGPGPDNGLFIIKVYHKHKTISIKTDRPIWLPRLSVFRTGKYLSGSEIEHDDDRTMEFYWTAGAHHLTSNLLVLSDKIEIVMLSWFELFEKHHVEIQIV